MTGEFDRLWAGDREGAHVEIGQFAGAPYLHMFDGNTGLARCHGAGFPEFLRSGIRQGRIRAK